VSTLYLDIETYSTVPIGHGTHAYAEKAEILLAAWAWNDEPVEVWDLTRPLNHHLHILLDQANQVVIHNSHFDRTVLKRNGIDLPAEKIRDTMVTALAHSLPGSLGKLCEILQVPTDQAKDRDGKRLINLFCKPRPKNQKLRRATRLTHPEDWQKFLDYARLDIEAMRAVDRKLPRWNWTDAERQLWLLDQKINDRGVAIDMDLVHAAIAGVDRAQADLADRTQAITDGSVWAATQRDAMLRYILEAHGLALDDLRGATVEHLLQDETLPADLRELLQVRLQASTTSTAKYAALKKATSSDGRLRGTLQFCGASRTGRWAGRLFQPQNLPRPTIGDLKDDELQAAIDAGIDMLKADCADLLTDNVMELTSSAIRGCIVAPAGKKLVVADLANIEGRVLAWLAGEEWKLKAFRDYDEGHGPDLYKLAYARSFRVKPEEVTKAQRQVGKVMELALGYEGGVGAFVTFAAAYNIDLDAMAEAARPTLGAGLISEANSALAWAKLNNRPTFGLRDETWVVCDAIKRAWRCAHPRTTELWPRLADAVRLAIHRPGDDIPCGKVKIRRNAAWLRIILPSGRSLCYPGARVDEGGQISYMGVNQYSRRWERLKTYGGKLVENVTQACARDILAAGMTLADAEGYEIVLSVHDELITETPDDASWSSDGLATLMSVPPVWATGLPLAAAGFETHRYRKD